METRSNPLLQRIILCLGIVLTIWGCDNVPQKSENNQICQNCKEIDSLYDIAWDLGSNNPSNAKKIAETMIEKSKESNYLQGFANAYNLIGGIYRRKGIHDKAIDNYYLSINYFKKMSDTAKAKIGIAKVNINIGTVFVEQENYLKASEFYSKALNVFEENKDSIKIFAIYINLGTIFDYQKKYNRALEFYLNSLEISKKIRDKNGISMSYNNIGNIHRKKGDYKKALYYFSESLILKKEMGDKEWVARLLMNIGTTYKEQKKYQDALIKVNESLEISQEIGSKKLIKENYLTMAEIYDGINDCSKAYNYYQLYSEIKDSILNQESARQVAEAATKYETVEKEKEIAVLNKDRVIKEAQAAKERQKFYFLIVAIFIVLLVAILLFRLYKKVARQKGKIAAQRDKIAEHEKEMTDSIDYARYIQQAIMPTDEEIYSALPNSFVFFKPKDIVSGDFIWFHKSESDVFIAVADCTGHGVPGAMVSVVCNNALNRSVREFGIIEPAKILDKAKELVLETFARREEDVKDGMDIALVKLNTESRILQYAGANRPLWIIRNDGFDQQIEEGKATKMPVGKSDRKEGFDEYEFRLNPGDTFYLSSDGYADQFGGPAGKKFMTKQFKNLLLSIQDKDMKKQGEIIDKAIEEWKHPNSGIVYEQIDDNAVIGIKIA